MNFGNMFEIFSGLLLLIGMVYGFLLGNVFLPVNPVAVMDLKVFGYGCFIAGCLVACGLMGLVYSYLEKNKKAK